MTLTVARLAIMVLLLFMALSVSANMVYVDDTLRVGVRSEPGHSVAPKAIIETGDRVELLEQSGDYYRIRTADGVEGWVGAKYMSKEPPAQQQLEGLDAKNSQLQTELTQAQKKAADADKLAEENVRLRREVAHLDNDPTWLLWFSGILAVGPLGFLFGLLWYRYQIMKKLGGLTL